MRQNGNPFPGLRSYEREQAHLFFGRDEQINDLIARLRQHRFLPIVGVSGSGKSSLVRAGLIPALTGSYTDTATAGWRIAILRPGRNPIDELAIAISREFAITENDVLLSLTGSSAGLARIAQQYLATGEKLLILVDQFEEIFRYGDDNARREVNEATAFVKLLLAASGESGLPLPEFAKLPVYVVTTMRSDFLGMCSRFRGLPEALNRSQYLIPRLTREQQRDVIEGPIGMTSASIEPALVQRLVNDIGDNPDRLPALQHALMRTWEHSAPERAHGKAIANADYEAVGGMADALNRDADRVYESLSSNDVWAAITRRLFQRLVQAGAQESETRSPTPFSELVATTAADEGDLKQVIGVFEERGFLTMSRGPDPIIDITHESLIRGWKQLTTWVQEEARSAAIYRRLADTAALYANNEASLLVDPQLQLTLSWRDETKPNAAWAARYDSRFVQAMDFLEQSRKERDDALKRTEQQRQVELYRARATAFVLGALLLFAIAAGVFAVIQWRETRAERDRSSRLLYDSNVYFASTAVASGQFNVARDRLTELIDTGLSDLRGFEWFHLWTAVHAEDVNLWSDSQPVRSVSFSPDGQTLAATGIDSVKLWDITTHNRVATLSGHSGVVNCVTFSPDGKTLASAGDDKTVMLWDSTTHEKIATLSGHSESVTWVTFSPDGKTLASTSQDKTVKLWDTITHKEVTTLSGSAGVEGSAAFSPDGKLLAYAGEGQPTLVLWNIAQKQSNSLPLSPGFGGPITSITFSPDGKKLAVSGYNDIVKLWDVATRKELIKLSGHSSAVPSVAFSPDSKTVASAGFDGMVKLWDASTGKELATLPSHLGFVYSVAFARDGRTVASGGYDGTVKLWNASMRREHATLSGHSEAINSVALSPDGKLLASASADHSVKLWDIIRRKEVATLSGHTDAVSSVAWSPDGKILASASEDKSVKLWELATGKELTTLLGHSGRVLSVLFSPDGKILASAGMDTKVKLWDATNFKELSTLTDYAGYVRSIAFMPDSKVIGYASREGDVKLWDISAGKELATYSGPFGSIWLLGFSPDGKTLALAAGDIVQFWDTVKGAPFAVLQGHSGGVYALAFSPDGKTIATAGSDKTVKLWDTATRKEVASFSGHSEVVWSVAFSADGRTLASGSKDKTIQLWFAATDEEVQQQRRLQD